MKKRQRQLLIVGIALLLIYLMRDKIRALMQGKGASTAASGGGGGGGGIFGGGSTANGGVTVGPYSVPGATVSETSYVDYKPPTGASEQMLPAYCISDAFTLNGVDYCIALDNRGQEVTRRIS
jgi:hypothetical protein